MRLLLDTHTFLWWDSEPSRLSAGADAAIRNPANEVYFSVVCVWELAIKSMTGKLTLRLPLSDIVAVQLVNGLRALPVETAHVLAVLQLPPAHRDPFDRILAAQALSEGAVLVTSDHIFTHYPARTLW